MIRTFVRGSGHLRRDRLLVALVAMLLVEAAPVRAQAPTASARYDLGRDWVAVCQAPCLVRTLGSSPALIAIAASTPVGDDVPATVLTFAHESGLPITVGTAYARAFSNTTRVVVMPYAIGGGGGGGGGDASAANQQAEIASLGADGTSPPTITGTGIRGWLRAIYERLTGTLAVSATSLPLPAGAATAANQGTANTSLASLDAKTPALINGRQPVDTGTTPAAQTTSGALQPPTAAAGKKVRFSVSLAANTSTQLRAAQDQRIGFALQCASGNVSIDETGAALTGAGVGNGTTWLPTAGSRFSPEVATLTAITAYSPTAQICAGSEDLR